MSCSKGNAYPRYFEYTPNKGDIGSTALTLTVLDNNGNVLGKAETTLVTVSKDIKSDTKNVLCFGDSLTSGGYWCQIAEERLPDNIMFCGAKTAGKAKYFGVGGWQWLDYTQSGRYAIRFEVTGVTSLSIGAVYVNNGVSYTIMEVNVTDGVGNILCSPSNNNVNVIGNTLTMQSGNSDSTITFTSWEEDQQNPLWDGTKLTFIPYAEKYADGKIDFVYTLLSWNGQTANRTDFSSVITEVEKFARTLHSEFPNAKLKIMGLQVPSVNGGMGANYGATGSGYANAYGMVVTALNQNEAYKEFCNRDEFKDYCEFINVSTQFDSEYNMPQKTKNVNTRNNQTEIIGTNGVHPTNDGYAQIGDVCFRSITAKLQ